MSVNYLACINPNTCSSLQINRAITHNPGITLLYQRTGKLNEEGIITFAASSRVTAELFLQSLTGGKKDATSQLLALSDFSCLRKRRHEP